MPFWCTSATQGFFEEAIRSHPDAYNSGKISEQQVHLARESGVAFTAVGNHAKENAAYGQWVDTPQPVLA
jgi:putative NIF3 family GTP cyclohydrolase 1 type 2